MQINFIYTKINLKFYKNSINKKKNNISWRGKKKKKETKQIEKNNR
jgi:hypothetical protein